MRGLARLNFRSTPFLDIGLGELTTSSELFIKFTKNPFLLRIYGISTEPSTKRLNLRFIARPRVMNPQHFLVKLLLFNISNANSIPIHFPDYSIFCR